MADICIRRQNVAHLNEPDLPALHAEVDRALAAGETAAHDDDLIADLVFLFIIIVDNDNIFTVKTRNRRDQRAGADGDDQGIGIFTLRVFLRDLRVQADLDARVAAELRVGEGELVHLMLERQSLLALQDTAESVFFLAQNDLVSAAGSCPCGVESARTSAGDKNFLLYRCRIDLIALHLAADDRIYCAAAGGCGGALGHAGEAAQAFDNITVAVLCDFSREERVCQELARHVYDVRLAGRDDLLHLLRVGETADCSHRLRNMLLYLSCEEHVAAVVREHGRVCDPERFLISSRGYMNEVNVRLDQLCDLYSFLDSVALVDEFSAAHAELDREERSDSFADRFQYFDCKSSPVLNRSPILIFSLVEHRRQELVDEPAVTAVYHQHFKSRSLHKPGHVSIGTDDFIDHVLCEGFDLNAVCAYCVRRSPLAQRFLLALVCHICSGEHARMRELN